MLQGIGLLLPYPAVDAFAQQVGVPAVAGVFLDPANPHLPDCDALPAQPRAHLWVPGQHRVGCRLLTGEVSEGAVGQRLICNRSLEGGIARPVQPGCRVSGSAATIALVAKEPEDERRRDFLMYDFGQATANMMLAAADLRIGSGHSAVIDQGQAQRVLGFPDGYFAVYLIGLGYPADRPLRPLTRPNRRPFDEVVHWNRW